MTAVIPWVGAGGEPEELPPAAARAFLERQTLPSPARAKQVAHWYATEGSKGLFSLLLRAPYLALCELRPIFRGLGRMASGWSRWCAVADFKELISEADGNKKADRGKELMAKRSANRKLSIFAVLVLLGAGTWTYFHYPLCLLLVGVAFVLICDAVGRAGTERAEKLPPPMRTVLREGVPLSQVTAAIIETLAREGLEVGVASPLRYDGARHEYRIKLSLLDELKAEHLRAIERGIGADDHTVRNLSTGTATVRELVIRDGDPLTVDKIPPPEWIPTGSISIEDGPLDLGESMTEVPFALDFAGVHIRCVAGTGGGKTSWFLRICIDRLSACRDVVIWGCDLTRGPELPLWRDVIQRRAFDANEAEKLLNAALAEIDRRAKILAAFAEDDDETNDWIIEWGSHLGPWLVIVVDEFSTLAEFNGKPQGELDLLAKAKQIVRTGRKHGVSLVMFAQRTGVEDFGSTVMSTQAGTAIVGPCDMTDTVNVFGKDRRDQGWAPHLLVPGTKDSPNDSGKCYIDSPRHRTADLYRAYLPLSAGEVKRRARQRMSDGLPTLDGRPADVVEAQELPTILADVEKAFSDAGNPDRLATADLLVWLDDNGYDLDAKKLADQLRPLDFRPNARWRPAPGVDSIRGYFLSELRDALGKFDG